MRKIVKNKQGVSEIVGVIVMLGMAIALFSVVYIMAITFPFNNPSPLVRISATIQDDAVILLHKGGESLSPNTNIIVEINGEVYTEIVANWYGYNGPSWNIGEKLSSKPLGDGVKIKEARITVVDVITNSIIMQGTVKGG
ncbi:MAG: hypothetical protein A3K77_03240 [Euryarchaeota archaeon RBG_13_31_8]|nr:MAG: hypothetical protein A3K77_03240 [Euryarchaeota archaeon RBG_13_31_8]